MTAPETFDVVIVGAGPVGLVLSTLLSRWGYKIKHIDNRPVPTATGRADGIQPRSLELLRNMGLKRAIMAYDPARVYEVAFWDPRADAQGIHKTGNWASCPKFIDARYPFTALLHQGMIERVFIEDIQKHGTKVERPWTITGFENDGKDATYPVQVQMRCLDTNVVKNVRTKYLFSGEGARSFVREQLGVQIHHKDPIAHVWGVMDGVVKTNFPDILMKCTIHSDAGSIMVIPREDNMVRLYIQIASSTDKDWNPRKTATAEEVQETAKKILKPYTIEWERVEWYSVYPIGQGIAERYTLDERVFMGGDCCHTHSPKAGQGMNTAFHDAVNMAWKIHHVESGLADRSILKTYESERKAIAEDLLNFDAKYAKLFSTRQPSAGEVANASQTTDDSENEFVNMFKSSCEFTSGYGIAYKPNIFNWSDTHPAQSPLFNPKGNTCRPGRVLQASTVTRVVDAYVVHLEQEIPLNGAFRIYIFGGNQNKTAKALSDFAANLQRKNSFYSTFEHTSPPPSSSSATNTLDTATSPHSKFFNFNLIFASAERKNVSIEALPVLFQAYRRHIYADNIFDERVPDAKFSAHAKMGLDPELGGVVVTRPDSHVACVVKLVEGRGTVDALNQFFSTFTAKKVGDEGVRAAL